MLPATGSPHLAGQDGALALEIKAALERLQASAHRGAHRGTLDITLEPLARLNEAVIDRARVTVTNGVMWRGDVIVVAPRNRAELELVWFPHTAAWTLLRLRAPLLFWPPTGDQSPLLTAERPTIIVPLDGRPASELALPYASALAEIVGGALLLVHVVCVARPESVARLSTEEARAHRLAELRAARRYLADVRCRLAKLTSATVSTKVVWGEPGSDLVALTRRWSAGAVVMTTHSEERGDRFFAGAVATQMVRQASAPTLLVPLEAVAGRHNPLRAD